MEFRATLPQISASSALAAEDERLTARAISDDNSREVHEAIALFERAYGDAYPVPRVTTREFWSAFAAKRGVRVGFRYDGELVAHIALKRSSTHLRRIEICLPVVAPEAAGLLGLVAERFSALLELQSRRQNLSEACFSSLADDPHARDFRALLTGFREVALLPGLSLPADPAVRSSLERRRSSVITLRFFDTASGEAPVVFLPRDGAGLIEAIYRELGVRRQLKESPPPVRSLTEPPFSVRYVRSREVLFCEPVAHGAAGGISLSATLAELPLKAVYVAVQAGSNDAPVYYAWLAGAGFRPCGVDPSASGADRMLFVRSELVPETVPDAADPRLAPFIAFIWRDAALRAALPTGEHDTSSAA